MNKVYKKRKMILEYCIVEEGIRSRRLGLKKEKHAVSLREENHVK